MPGLDNNAVWAEVDLAALSHNLWEVRHLVGKNVGIIAVVKANAYGHGLLTAAHAFLKAGANRLAVARLEEGIALRAAGISQHILVMGYVPPTAVCLAAANALTLTVSDYAYAKALSELAGPKGVKVQVHVKVDTGMGRLGLLTGANTANKIIALSGLPHISVEGLYTHFANADSADLTHARNQLQRFTGLLEELRRKGWEPPYVHAANSGAVIQLPESHLQAVRAGIMLYGLKPSAEVSLNSVALQPAMALKARLAYIKKVPADFCVSYGSTYKTPVPTLLGTVPCGYGDGYNRLLSNRGMVLIRGKRVPVVGRVCMDQIVVDVGAVPDVTAGDEVVLFGRQGAAQIHVDELAEQLNTINYEIVCGISSRVPRVYL